MSRSLGGSCFHATSTENGQNGLPERSEAEGSDSTPQLQLRSRNTSARAAHFIQGHQAGQHGAGREVQARRGSSEISM